MKDDYLNVKDTPRRRLDTATLSDLQDLLETCSPDGSDVVIIRVSDLNHVDGVMALCLACLVGTDSLVMVLPPGFDYDHVPLKDLERWGLARRAPRHVLIV